eukprot:963053-Pyramimonas_sp.AAC.1
MAMERRGRRRGGRGPGRGPRALAARPEPRRPRRGPALAGRRRRRRRRVVGRPSSRPRRHRWVRFEILGRR